jgi:hypothetical protein
MRETEIQTRLKLFLRDLALCIKSLESTEDKIHFAKTLSELQLKMYRNAHAEFGYNDENFNEDDFIDKNLLAKFRHKMKPFVETQLHFYFSPDESSQECIYQRLQINNVIILDWGEFYEFTIRLNNILDSYKINLYLTEPGNSDDKYEVKDLQGLAQQKQEENLKGNLKIQNNEFSRSRQALAMYYLFKSLGITTRFDIDVVHLAKFAHLLSAMPYDKMDNSSIYKGMKGLPNFKNEKYLLEDLKFINKHFSLVKHTAAVSLIEEEIAILEEKLKLND